jgi:tetratricopeptide (TPR) repeat protein
MLVLQQGNAQAAAAGLERLWAAGDVDATGLLACAQRQLGEPRAYLMAVSSEDSARMTPAMRAYYERERGLLHQEREEWHHAAHWFERAWNTCQHSDLRAYQLAPIGQDFAQMLERLGEDARAVQVLEAYLSAATDDRRLVALARLHLCLTRLGRLSDAAALEPGAGVAWAYARMVFERYSGRPNAALLLGADRLVFPPGEHMAQADYRWFVFYQAVLATRERSSGDANNLLAMTFLRDNADTERERAFLSLLEARECLHTNNVKSAEFRTSEAIARFAYQQLRREEALAHLVMVEVCERIGEPLRAQRSLERALEIATPRGLGFFLECEARALPRARELLARSNPRDSSAEANVITVYDEHLTVNGKPLRLRYKGAARLFKYVVANPEFTMEAVCVALEYFDANWIHQLKHALCREVPGLSIEYDREQKRYTTRLENAVVRYADV